MNKQYTFLQEIVGTTIFGALTLMSALSLVKNLSYGSFSNKYINFMTNEMNNCPPQNRQAALKIINKYAAMLSQMYSNVDKKTMKKIQYFENLFRTNYYIPLKNIITNQNDPNWKQTATNYILKNNKKIKNKNRLNNTVHAVSLGASGAAAGGIAAASAVSGVLFTVRNVADQLKFFNGQRYIKKMEKELKACQENDRQTAVNIVNKYCFNIAKYIQNSVDKTGKQIPFNIQDKMRNEFLNPLLSLITDQNNKYWKVMVLDRIQEQKIQQTVSHISNTVAYALLPKVLPKK